VILERQPFRFFSLNVAVYICDIIFAYTRAYFFAPACIQMLQRGRRDTILFAHNVSDVIDDVTSHDGGMMTSSKRPIRVILVRVTNLTYLSSLVSGTLANRPNSSLAIFSSVLCSPFRLHQTLYLYP